jgi:hypothetical protein
MVKVAALLLFVSGLFAAENFRPFFNGKDLTEFEIYTPGIWTVENGMIVGRTAGLKHNDFLRTRRNYRDFELRLQFRLKDGVGNSGIQFRSVPVPGSPEVSGYQADIGEKYWGCLYDESRRKKVLVQAPPNTPIRHSDWNDYVITAQGPKITLELNGVKTVEYTEQEAGIAQDGFIALQVHSGPAIQVEFRNLKIRELR